MRALFFLLALSVLLVGCGQKNVDPKTVHSVESSLGADTEVIQFERENIAFRLYAFLLMSFMIGA